MKASLRLAGEIRNRIASGELVAGDALPVESELEHQFGLSKPVVREALRILETEGLVEVRRGLGGGPRVRYPSIAEAAMGIGVFLKIGDVPMVDLLETRDAILGSTIERLATMRHDVDLTPLQEAVAGLRATVTDWEGYYLRLVETGDLVVELGANQVDRVLVVALRPLIAAELEHATDGVLDANEALQVVEDTTAAWERVLRNVKAGHGRAARAAFDESAGAIRVGLKAAAPGLTVGDMFRLVLARDGAE